MLGSAIILRLCLRRLDALVAELRQQNALLLRLANQIAPLPAGEPVSSAEASVDYSNDGEQGRILDFTEKVLREQGRPPTEEEVLMLLEGRAHGFPVEA